MALCWPDVAEARVRDEFRIYDEHNTVFAVEREGLTRQGERAPDGLLRAGRLMGPLRDELALPERGAIG